MRKSSESELAMKQYPVILFISLFVLIECSSQSSRAIREVPRSERKNLMVLNFKNATPKTRAQEYMPWEFGIASMLMTDLECIGLFNLIGREQIKSVVAQQEFQLSGLVDPSKAVAIGKIAAAKYMLAGTFMEMNGMLRIESQVFSVETGAQLGAAAVSGKTDAFFDLEKELVVKVSRYLNAALTEAESARIRQKVETRSVRASLSNYAGEIALMNAEDLKAKGRDDSAKAVLGVAKERFTEALKFDPNYERAKKNLAKIAMSIPVTL